MLLKSEIMSPLFWGDEAYTIGLPKLTKGEILYLDVTLNTFGRIKGLFVVEQCLHVYEKQSYTQRLHLRPHCE
jgi:hypothetical protein